MSTLGDSFPRHLVSNSIDQNLTPGRVFKSCQIMDDGSVHEKRFVLLHRDENCLTVVISSKVSNYIQARPSMNRCQVEIHTADHPFMQRNSFIDCSRIKKYKTEDVLEQLVNNSDWILGEIDEVVRGNICDALTNSPLVTPFDRKTCIKSLIR